MNKWISVRDETPPLGESVDLFSGGERHIDVYLDHYSPKSKVLMWYTGRANIFHVESTRLTLDDFWMRKPEPPEQP